jgi:YjjG family noncanonical pyrimidine nucleotidase
MRYTTLLFDLDHTLLDSVASEQTAFDLTLRAAGVDDPRAYFSVFADINSALWAGVERGDLSPNQVRSMRFEQLVAAAGLGAAPREMADTYVRGLGANGDLYPGALDMLTAVSDVATLALVTNGIGEVQRARIARTGIGPFFDAIVISGEVGTSKPGAAIFDLTFAELGNPERETTLMIGDNLSSDIVGGIDYGIDTCWYAPADTTTDLAVTHRIDNLLALPSIVSGAQLPSAPGMPPAQS